VPVDPTAVPVELTAVPIDLSMAFDMHMDPTVLKELLRMPPYKGPFIPLDFETVDCNMHLFNIPQDLPAPIIGNLPILLHPMFHWTMS
jgi:hypothetical protein